MSEGGQGGAKLSIGTLALRAIVGTAADPDQHVVVTHKPNILDAFGKDWFEIKEGEASIFKPAGGGKYAPIARVQIGEWATARK